MIMKFAMTSDYLLTAGDPQASLKRLADTGYTHIIWCHNWNTDLAYTTYEFEAYRKMLRDYGLTLVDIHGSCGYEHNWFSVLEHQRLAGVELVKNRLEMLRALDGEGAVVMHQPRLKPRLPEAEVALKRQQYISLRRSLDELIPYLEKHKQQIALENLPGDNWEFLAEIFRDYQTDRIGLCFDSGHANMKIKKHLAQVNEHCHLMLATHLHDNDASDDQHLPPFSGSSNWNRIAGILKKAKNVKVPAFEVLMGNTEFFDHKRSAGNQSEEDIRKFLIFNREQCEKVVRLIENATDYSLEK